jgi:DNA-binding protein H-NS
MLNDAENVVSDESEGLAAAEQEATDEPCGAIEARAQDLSDAAIDMLPCDEDQKPIETRLILPHLDRLTFDDLQYIADKLDTYLVEVQATLEQNREERLKELQERIERDKAELAALSPVPVSAGKAKMENPSKPKYRDPAKPENTWAGRGKRPHWLERELAAGKKLEDFLIDKPEPVPGDTGF